MAISYVGQNTAEADTVSIPSHQSGDLIIIFAFRDDSTTAPSLPGGWSSPSTATQAGTSCSARVGYIIGTGSTTSGTWTNAIDLVVHVYRGAHALGGIAWNTATSATITWSDLLTADPTAASGNTAVSDSTSWIAGFAGDSSTDGSLATAPSGMTNRSVQEGATADAGGHDTNGGVASFSTTTTAYGGTSSNYVSVVLEILVSGAANISTLTDDFTALNTSKWAAFGTSSVTAGALNLVPSSLYDNVLYSTSAYDLTGSSIVALLVQPPNIGNGSTFTSITVRSVVNVDNDCVEELFWYGDNTLGFRERINTVNDDTTLAYNSSQHKWLRIRESGGTVYWDTSADGINFTNQRSKTAGSIDLTCVRVEFWSGYNAVEPSPGTAIWDSLNLVNGPGQFFAYIR